MYTIHSFHTKAKCEYAGREGEAVEISSADGSIDHAILCFPELQKILRFRQSQIEKKNGESLKEKKCGIEARVILTLHSDEKNLLLFETSLVVLAQQKLPIS